MRKGGILRINVLKWPWVVFECLCVHVAYRANRRPSSSIYELKSGKAGFKTVYPGPLPIPIFDHWCGRFFRKL
ncbi:hypothetical protein PPACK8108_LOCUS13730 [Phakopsora pachyrhizi]|uniref:Secreted protein n=1 Tax=Phakopsora pachyrhizi TaxID=170000 RepID=A0AAV0B758_PHAPC|nr:hypothetical protein PPACK8108_LOCUS13730 [Phakopsora pachyrhizi]